MEDYKKEKFKKEVAKQHSIVRRSPKSYIYLIKEQLKNLKGKILHMPGLKHGIKTVEGETAYLECIDFLNSQTPIGVLKYDEELSKASQDHADDIKNSGITAHIGSDGSSPDDRIERYLEWEGINCQNIDFGLKTAEEVIISLIIDDGFKDRPQRAIIFDPDLQYLGVGVSDHPDYTLCTVLNYVETISSYHKKNANKPLSKNILSGKNKVEEDKQTRKLSEINDNDVRDSSPIANNLGDKFRKQIQIKGNEQQQNVSQFSDDPHAPKGAVSVTTKTQTRTRGKIVEKKITNTYTLEDGSQEIVQYVERDD